MLKVGLNGFERSGAPGLRKMWRGGRVLSSVRAARGATQVGWQALLAGLTPQTRVCVRLGSSGSNAGGLAGGFGGFRALGRCFLSPCGVGVPRPSSEKRAPPHHTQKSESRPRRPFVECLGGGGGPASHGDTGPVMFPFMFPLLSLSGCGGSCASGAVFSSGFERILM